MREKKQWLIVTFYTTSAAMAAEKACGKAGLPGRIIPVPREITADCGLGWRTAPENRERTESLFQSLSLETDDTISVCCEEAEKCPAAGQFGSGACAY